MKKVLFLYLLLLVNSADAQAPGDKMNFDWLLTTYPEKVERLFHQLDLEHPGLQRVKNAVASADYRRACHLLIDYYRTNSNFTELRQPELDGADLAAADRILADTFTFQDRSARQRREPDGTLDWTYRGPKDDAEWAFFLNRHQWMKNLTIAYRKTGNERYAGYLNRALLDWIVSNSAPVSDTYSPPWHPLNTAIRFRSWPAVFYGMQQSGAFSDATRLLMLISLIEQGDRLRRFHWTHQNHALYELNGLARIAAYWPELRRSDEWFDYAARHLLYELEGQVLPDGVQDELSSMYHYGALQQFQQVVELAGRTGRTLPTALREGVEKMYNYLAYSMRPDGYNLLNNDSDRNDYRPQISEAASLFNRPDWSYITSNGNLGEQPEETSILVAYAGQVIMRNGWHEGAHWSYFDGGPHGTAHRHDDKLHLSVAAYGRDLLVDGGRYWYRSDIWREYFVSSYSHNVVLVDGFGHRPDVNRYDSPDQVAFETTPEFTYAQATFDAGFRETDDTVTHTRGVLYLKDRFWIVIDRLRSKEPHRIQPLWHFHPDCRVVQNGDQVYSNDAGKGNLLIQPIGAIDWSPELHFGPDTLDNPEAYREWKPRSFDAFPIQGSYSERYNQKRPAYVAVYDGEMEEEVVFAWLLVPFEREKLPEKIRAGMKMTEEQLLITVEWENAPYQVKVDFVAGKVIKVEIEK